MNILGVSIESGTVTLEDGQVVPITNWFCGGEEIAGPETATTFVAGPCADGQWYAGTLEEDDFE